jgi:membrane-associated phospholipid phosphatase
MMIIAGFVLLTVFVLVDPLSKVDQEFSEEVQEHHNAFLDTTMQSISWAGYTPNSEIMVASVTVMFLLFRYKREALFICLTGTAGLISTLFKLLVNRPRPQSTLVHVLEKTKQQSFPSGHTLFYTVFFGFLALLMFWLKDLPKWFRRAVTAVCFLLIFTVPLSRIYLGAHWFTDVTAGFLLGLIVLYAINYFYLKKSAAAKN